MKPASPQRVDALINRLTKRNRLPWAARIFGNWLEQLRDEAEEHSKPTLIHHLWRYGRLLSDAGDFIKAEEVFREMVSRQMEVDTGPVLFFLKRSFDEWARCLDALGNHKSAQETRTLGRRLAIRRQKERDEEEGQLRTLLPSRLIGAVAGRITFGMSLEWESQTDTFNLFEEDGFLTLRDRFRQVDGHNPWLELEAKAPAGRDWTHPHVTVCVKFPWHFVNAAQMVLVLARVNEMNLDNSACSTCFEAASGQIAIRSRIGFAGYNDAVEPLNDLAAAQEEGTLNMFAEVLGMAVHWESRNGELYNQLCGPVPGL
jgi:pentatricopeptide repeat protein